MKNINKIDLNLLHTLLVLLEEKSASRSAARLNLTQPTVSNSLARLRSAFDDPLFTRTRHGLVPTSRALALEPELRNLFTSVDSILAPKEFDQENCDSTVVLSANDYMQYVILAPAVREIRRKAPNMRIAIRHAEIGALVPMLDQGQIDMAVTIPEFSDKRLRSQHLYDERYIVAARKRRGKHVQSMSMDEFLHADHAIVSPTAGRFWGPTDDALKGLGLERNVAFSVSSFFTMIELVANSEVIALIPERLSERFSDRLSLTKPPLEVAGFEVILAWSNKTHRDPVMLWVREQILQSLQ